MSALQEEITQKTLALCVQTGKMTAQLLQQAMKKVLADMEKHKNESPAPSRKADHPAAYEAWGRRVQYRDHGSEYQGVLRYGKKYGIDFALKKIPPGRSPVPGVL